jgi:hypothetical protein
VGRPEHDRRQEACRIKKKKIVAFLMNLQHQREPEKIQSCTSHLCAFNSLADNRITALPRNDVCGGLGHAS